MGRNHPRGAAHQTRGYRLQDVAGLAHTGCVTGFPDNTCIDQADPTVPKKLAWEGEWLGYESLRDGEREVDALRAGEGCDAPKTLCADLACICSNPRT